MKGTVEARPPAAEQPVAATSWQTIAQSRIGQTVGDRLTLERVLGIGGTATVYAARHRNGRALAVKILHPEFSHHAEIRQRFLAEGYAANKVDHPDAVAVLDDGEGVDGSAFLVMELLRGRSLLTRLEESGPLPPGDVVSMALRVLDVLAHGHERGVVHRDVKPSNIFQTDEGAIKLLDYGIARVQDGQGAFLTLPGTTLGTPAFMAPELAAGRLEQLDALTDLWALGATMFQLLTADVVHPSRNDNELLVLAATTPARSLAALRPDLEPTLVAVIDRALAFERRNRWPNARAMSQALVAAARRAGYANDHPSALVGVSQQFETAPEMALPASRAEARPASKGARWATGVAVVLAIVGAVLATQYRVRNDIQAKSGEAMPPSAPARLTAAASNAAPAVQSSAPSLLEKPAVLPSKPTATALHPNPVKHVVPPPSPAAASAAPKNPLFFPGQ
jgi:serine/threonine-protein kinase